MNEREVPGRSLVDVAAGEVILREDALGTGLYVLMRGRLEVLRSGIRIAEISLKGSYVGEISSILGCPCSATVRALENSQLFHVPKVTEYFEQNPQAAHVLAQTLARRIMDMNAKCVALERLVREVAGSGVLPPAVLKRINKALTGLHSSACGDSGPGIAAS